MDDEVERRLRALKGEPGSDAGGEGGGARAGADDADPGAALSGEVIEPGPGQRRSQSDGPAGRSRQGGRATGSHGPAVRAVGWSIGEARAGRLGLWFGVALLAFGGYLVAVEFVPGLRIVGSIALIALGAWALLWRALRRAGTWALYVGAILVGYGAGGIVAELVANGRGGWGSLGVGVALLTIAAGRAARGGGVGWQAWIGGFLAIWGAWGALGSVIPGFPTAGDLAVPVLLVLAGVFVVRRGLR